MPNKLADIKNKLQTLDSTLVIDLAVASHHDFSNPLLRYPLLIRNKTIRDSLHEALSPFGSSIMYKKPLYDIKGIPVHPSAVKSNLSNAQTFADQLITLPTHKDVSSSLLEEIINQCMKIIK